MALEILLTLGCVPSSLTLRSGALLPSPLDDGPAVLAFDRPLRAADRLALVEAGWTPIAPIGAAWIARGPGSRPAGVRWTGALSGELRVDPALREPGDAIGVAELAPGADVDRIVQGLAADGLPVDGIGRRLVSRLREDQVDDWIDRLADDPDVVWLTRRGRRVLLDRTGAIVGQSGLDGRGATPFTDAGLDGRGQIGAVLDTGVDLDHCAFVDPRVAPAIETTGTSVAASARKVVAVDFLWSADDPADPLAWDDQGHGSHVAGIVAGDEGADGVLGDGDGVALGAKLVIQDAGYAPDDCADLPALGCPTVALGPLFAQAYAQGARVHSDSWGDQEGADVTNVYSDGSVDADQASWDHPDLLLVFAAGNNGDRAQVFSPGNAKDTLSVGATLDGTSADQVLSVSSGGPTADGRIKPDLVFPGLATSAWSDLDVGTGNCDDLELAGTSMATPGVAGLALVVRQYFADGWSPSGSPVPSDGFSPTSALVKAALIASAQPVDADRDFAGWGRPELDRALPLDPSSPRRLLAFDERDTAPFSGGEAPFEVPFHVDSDVEPLVVVLVWRDPPGTPLSDPVLVDDLDLVVASGGDSWLGNQLGEVWSPPGGSPDRRNNVEVVRIERPAEGDYTARVAPHQIAIGPLPYALIVSGAVSRPAAETGDTAAPSRTYTGGDATPPHEPRGCGCAGSSGGTTGSIVALVALFRRRHRALAR
jgi:hypothetical protein